MLRLWQHNHTPSLDGFVQDDCIQEGTEAGPQQLQFHQTWPERYKRAAGNEQPVETKLVNLYLHLHSLDADLKIFCERKDRKVS